MLSAASPLMVYNTLPFVVVVKPSSLPAVNVPAHGSASVPVDVVGGFYALSAAGQTEAAVLPQSNDGAPTRSAAFTTTWCVVAAIALNATQASAGWTSATVMGPAATWAPAINTLATPVVVTTLSTGVVVAADGVAPVVIPTNVTSWTVALGSAPSATVTLAVAANTAVALTLPGSGQQVAAVQMSDGTLSFLPGASLGSATNRAAQTVQLVVPGGVLQPGGFAVPGMVVSVAYGVTVAVLDQGATYSLRVGSCACTGACVPGSCIDTCGRRNQSCGTCVPGSGSCIDSCGNLNDNCCGTVNGVPGRCLASGKCCQPSCGTLNSKTCGVPDGCGGQCGCTPPATCILGANTCSILPNAYTPHNDFVAAGLTTPAGGATGVLPQWTTWGQTSTMLYQSGLYSLVLVPGEVDLPSSIYDVPGTRPNGRVAYWSFSYVGGPTLDQYTVTATLSSSDPNNLGSPIVAHLVDVVSVGFPLAVTDPIVQAGWPTDVAGTPPLVCRLAPVLPANAKYGTLVNILAEMSDGKQYQLIGGEGMVTWVLEADAGGYETNWLLGGCVTSADCHVAKFPQCLATHICGLASSPGSETATGSACDTVSVPPASTSNITTQEPALRVTRDGGSTFVEQLLPVTNTLAMLPITVQGVDIAPGDTSLVVNDLSQDSVLVEVHDPKLPGPAKGFPVAKNQIVTRFPEWAYEGLVTPEDVGSGTGEGATVVHVTAPDGSSSGWGVVRANGLLSTAPIVPRALSFSNNITAVILYPPPFSNATVTAYQVTDPAGTGETLPAMTSCPMQAVTPDDYGNLLSWTFMNTGNIPLYCVSGMYWEGGALSKNYVYYSTTVLVNPGCSAGAPVHVSRGNWTGDMWAPAYYYMAAFLTKEDADGWNNGHADSSPGPATGGIYFIAAGASSLHQKSITWSPTTSTPGNTPSAQNSALTATAAVTANGTKTTTTLPVTITGIAGSVYDLAAISPEYDVTAYVPDSLADYTTGMILAFVNAFYDGGTGDPAVLPADTPPYYPLPRGPLFLMTDASDMLVVTVQNNANTSSAEPWLFTLPYLVMFPPTGDQPAPTLGPYGLVTATTASGAVAKWGTTNVAAVASAAIMVVNPPPAVAPGPAAPGSGPAPATVPVDEPVAEFVSTTCGLPSLSNGNQLTAGLFRDCGTGAPTTQCPSTEKPESCCIGSFANGRVGDDCFSACNQAAGSSTGGAATLAACETMAEQYCAAQGDGVVPGLGDVAECACVNYERSCITQPLLDGNYTYCEFLVEFAIAFGKATQQLWSSIQCWWPPCAPGTPNVLRPSAKLAGCPDCIKVCIALIENVEVQNSSVNITAQCTLACPNNSQPVTTGHQVYCSGLTPAAGPPGPPGPPGPGPPGCPPTDPRCPGYKPTCPVTQPTCPGYNPCVNDPGSCPGYCPPTQFGCPGYLPTPAGPAACPPTQPGCPGYPCSPNDVGCPGYNACPPSTPGCPGYVPPTPYWVPAATYAGAVLLVGLIIVLAVVYSLRAARARK